MVKKIIWTSNVHRVQDVFSKEDLKSKGRDILEK